MAPTTRRTDLLHHRSRTTDESTERPRLPPRVNSGNCRCEVVVATSSSRSRTARAKGLRRWRVTEVRDAGRHDRAARQHSHAALACRQKQIFDLRRATGDTFATAIPTPAAHRSSTPTEEMVTVKRSARETLVGLTAAGLACLLAGCSVGREESSSGPLSLGNGPSGVSYSADPGAVLTFGANIALNTGADPITLQSVDLVEGDAGGVDVEGVKVVALPGVGVTPVAITKGFPTPYLPVNQLRDVKGHIVTGVRERTLSNSSLSSGLPSLADGTSRASTFAMK